MDEIVQFDFPTDSPKIIKVIGVGGGGGNAVNHMYREGIHDVTFVLCNTDNQALAESPVPVKLQLGRSITQGLGAGNRPERARDAAEESIEDIKSQLNDGTKMVFITAGMGGGTGTYMQEIDETADTCQKTADQMGEELRSLHVDTEHQCALLVSADCVKITSQLHPSEQYEHYDYYQKRYQHTDLHISRNVFAKLIYGTKTRHIHTGHL